MDRLGRGDTAEYVRAAVSALDPDMLTIGFARRVATYKRLDLLLRDVDRALALLSDDERPVQLILAGKAHPKDDDGKRLVQRLFEMKGHFAVGRRVVYLDDYDLALGAAMVRGCDIWVNVPRPPLEASGTSGIKSAMNGGLQLSRARRLVAGGLRRHQRLGDLRRGRQRPRRAGLAPRRRALPAADRRGRADLLRARRPTGCRRRGSTWCATRCARSGRSSAPGRMVRDYAEQIYPAHVGARA